MIWTWLFGCGTGWAQENWGAWVLQGDGGKTAIPSQELPAAVTRAGGLLTVSELDEIAESRPETTGTWHDRVVVDDGVLVLSVDEAKGVGIVWAIDGDRVDLVEGVEVFDDGVSAISTAVDMGVAEDNGLIIAHAVDGGALRVHRELDGTWSYEDYADLCLWGCQIYQVIAYADEVVVLTISSGFRLRDGLLTETIGNVLSAQYDPSGRLSWYRDAWLPPLELIGNIGSTTEQYIETDDCSYEFEGSGWAGQIPRVSLSRGGDGETLAVVEDGDRLMLRGPVQEDCSAALDEWPRMKHQPGWFVQWGQASGYISAIRVSDDFEASDAVSTYSDLAVSDSDHADPRVYW